MPPDQDAAIPAQPYSSPGRPAAPWHTKHIRTSCSVQLIAFIKTGSGEIIAGYVGWARSRSGQIE